MIGQVSGRRMVFIRNINRSFAHVGLAGVTGKIPAHQFVVPGPVILRIGRGMDAHIAATRLDIAFKSSLLLSGSAHCRWYS